MRRPELDEEKMGGLRHPGLFVTLAVVLGIMGVLAIVFVPRIVGDREEYPDVADFYRVSEAEAAGTPGSLVRADPLQGHPFAAKAWRVIYRTTDLFDEPRLASAVVVTPEGKPPSEGRTVLAWGHPTTGVAENCAPSRAFDPFLDIEGLRMMLDRGYTVVATDYVGMGVPGPDSYLIGDTAARSMLDAVRAARNLDQAEAGKSVVLWGHSQGGQAALFAAERAGDYAPELSIEAVAVAAPAADLPALIEAHLDDVSGATIGSYAFQAYAEIYRDRGADLNTVLSAEAQGILKEMNSLCLLTDMDELHRIAEPVVGDFFIANPTTVAPWATLLEENSAGHTPFYAPLFVAQGDKDTLVIPEDTKRFAEKLQSQGMDVTFRSIKGADHGTVAYLALPALEAWLDARGV